MSPSKQPSTLLFATLGSLLAALFVAGPTYLSMLHHGHSWWRLFLW